MSVHDHLVYALGQMEMAEADVKPGDLSDLASANLHTAIFYLIAAISEISEPSKPLEAEPV